MSIKAFRSITTTLALCLVTSTLVGKQVSSQAIIGGTLIDGNGGAPIPDAVIVIQGNRLAAVGPRRTTPVPAGSTVIDASGRYIVPGFFDTNVHLSLYGGIKE